MSGRIFESLPVLREAELRSLVSVKEAIAVVRQAYRDYGNERLVLSQPESMSLKAEQTSFKLKGGRSPSHGTAGFRLVAQGGGDMLSHCIVLDAATGAPRGLVDETWLHRLRTAATAAVAAEWLAAPGAKRLSIVGAGRIADELPAAFREIFALEDIRVAARRLESARAYAERHGVTAVESVETAMDGADIVVVITAANAPVIEGVQIAPGATVLGLGGGAEIGASALDICDRFVVDDFEFAAVLGSVAGWIAGGRPRLAVHQRLSADIGEIAIGTQQGRTTPDERVLAIIQGMASCDVALASFALERAGEEHR
ncbi:hypothetical protein JP75_02055 [Devosia riboflavina]|uniref:Ornithine cyclodeaminase n=1 Tax=Devosia riboflavina TaxID=46914 RepID=A0A087M7T4_9HYPH|nr:hypothetical protein [Devosia riboflavina]KFL32937.1 hypothetical protein JP75_02055 [Devosia riboflavina]